MSAVSIKEMKELWDFLLSRINVCNVHSVWPWLFMDNLDTGNTKTKAGGGSGGDRFSAAESHSLSFSHLSLTASPLPHWQGKTRPVVVHSLDRGPRWPPSSNFRLHVNCAREPAPAIIQGHPSFYDFILENRSQPVFRHRAILETAEPLHYISVMILPVSVAACYPYVHFSVLFE